MRLLTLFLLLASSALGQSSTGGGAGTSSTFDNSSDALTSSTHSSGLWMPIRPLMVPNETPPDTTGYTTLVVTDRTTLLSQLAIAAAGCDNGGGSGKTGYVLSIPQGTNITYAGIVVTLPATTCTTSWIVTKTAGLSCGAAGTRIDPSLYVGLMAKLTTTQAYAGWVMASAEEIPANHYWFSCMEFENDGASSGSNYVIGIGTLVTTIGFTSHANLPHHFGFEHVYIHGRGTNEINHCLSINADNIVVVDSWISNCHGTSNGDAQAFNSVVGYGTLLKNTLFSASTEGIISGGNAVGAISQVIGYWFGDWTETGDWFYKPKQWFAGSPNYVGIKWTIKNMHEYKGMQRALVENFVMENTWDADQTGTALLAQGIPLYATQTTDATFQYGRMYGGTAAFGSSSNANSDFPIPRPRGRLMWRHILADNISAYNCANPPAANCINPSALYLFTLSGALEGLIIDHNTFTVENSGGKTRMQGILALHSGIAGHSNEDPLTNAYFTNNILAHGSYGIQAGGGFDRYADMLLWWGGGQPPTFLNNVITTPIGGGSTMNCATYGTNTRCPAAMANVGFVNYNNGADGDYELCKGVNLPRPPCAAASPYSTGCTVEPDGSGGDAPCGADIAAIMTRTANVVQILSQWPDSRSGGGIALSPTSLNFGASGTITITPVAGSAGGNQLVQSGLDLIFHGARVAPLTSSTSSVTFTATCPAVIAITNTELPESMPGVTSNVAWYTANNTFHIGDTVTVVGTNNPNANVFNITGTVYFANATTFRMTLNHAKILSSPDSGTATVVKVPVALDNFGFPLVAQLGCS